MTTYILSLRALGGDEVEPDPALTTLADLRTTDEAVMAATLRAVADRLDPPKPPRPAYRRGDHMRAAEVPSAPRSAETLGPYSWDTPGLVEELKVAEGSRIEPWMRRQTGEVLPPVRSRELHPEYLDDEAMPVLSITDPAPERVGSGNIPASLGVRRAGRDPRITPDGCGPEHTFTGSCALAPNQRD